MGLRNAISQKEKFEKNLTVYYSCQEMYSWQLQFYYYALSSNSKKTQCCRIKKIMQKSVK